MSIIVLSILPSILFLLVIKIPMFIPTLRVPMSSGYKEQYDDS